MCIYAIIYKYIYMCIYIYIGINKWTNKQPNKKKSIIYISSYATKTGGRNISHYVSSKSAIEILFKSIKKENQDSNISFKVLKPSNIFYNKNEKINKFSSDADIIVESIKNIIFKNIQ